MHIEHFYMVVAAFGVFMWGAGHIFNGLSQFLVAIETIRLSKKEKKVK